MSAASKPTGTPLPLHGARESGRGLSAPSQDHTMGAVSPASSTDQPVLGGAGGASRVKVLSKAEEANRFTFPALF